jgi:hypothetical protein
LVVPPAILKAHTESIQATNALEHVLLVLIRWQDTAPGGMGVLTRLKEWIWNYKDTAAKLAREGHKLQPRKGSRTAGVQPVRRNVAKYLEDLVRGSVGWGNVGSPTPMSLSTSRMWNKVIAAGAGEARFSESYRKRMNHSSDRVDG